MGRRGEFYAPRRAPESGRKICQDGILDKLAPPRKYTERIIPNGVEMFKTPFKMSKNTGVFCDTAVKSRVLNTVDKFCESFDKLRVVAEPLRNIQRGDAGRQKLSFFLVHFAIVEPPQFLQKFLVHFSKSPVRIQNSEVRNQKSDAPFPPSEEGGGTRAARDGGRDKSDVRPRSGRLPSQNSEFRGQKSERVVAGFHACPRAAG